MVRNDNCVIVTKKVDFLIKNSGRLLSSKQSLLCNTAIQIQRPSREFIQFNLFNSNSKKICNGRKITIHGSKITKYGNNIYVAR